MSIDWKKGSWLLCVNCSCRLVVEPEEKVWVPGSKFEKELLENEPKFCGFAAAVARRRRRRAAMLDSSLDRTGDRVARRSETGRTAARQAGPTLVEYWNDQHNRR